MNKSAYRQSLTSAHEKSADNQQAQMSQKDISIIGYSCRFPGASNPDEYWQNLKQGRSSIVEIPSDRWDWQVIANSPVNSSPVKWGGFIDDIDKFDPLFFKISPKEANYTDPQHRIFLEAVYHAIEDAGYSPSSLAGQKIGVYAGVSKNDYAELMRANHEPIVSFVSTGTVHSILSNRVSFLLDFHGKSESVDTACSSFLVALNNAVRDIRDGYCTSALVGSVNAILTPTMYISHSKSGMLSIDGRCKTFAADANGYVRSEGVGVVFIKSLSQALQDNDQQLGIIKGCAVAHGGRANSLTSPNVAAQASVITAALQDADISAQTISYVECHGTATPLGDPIEINGLKAAFQAYLTADFTAEQGAHCGLGSVKSNVGHLECAAGVAGLIKLLLCFKHQQLPGLLHHKQLNPYIELDDSPFYIVDTLRPWHRPGDGLAPRRAGLSSFGMGGVNAHVIVEEPPVRAVPEKTVPEQVQQQSRLILVSAKKGQLDAQIAQLQGFLNQPKIPELALDDISFTLMFGRDEFEQRFATVVSSIDELKQVLNSYIQKTDQQSQDSYYLGLAEGANQAVKPKADLVQLAKDWAAGQSFDWDLNASSGMRISLPTYPFVRRRCWFEGKGDIPVQKQAPELSQPELSQPEQSQPEQSQPELSQPELSQPEQSLWILPSQTRVSEHRVQQQKMLPAAGYLHLIQQMLLKEGADTWQIKDIYWLTAIVVEDEGRQIQIQIQIQIASQAKAGQQQLQISTDKSKHCTATLVTEPQLLAKQTIDVQQLQQEQLNSQNQLDHGELYNLFAANGLDYGPAFQVIETLYWNEKTALAVLDDNATFEIGILDGIFQTAAALSIQNHTADKQQMVPYYLEQFHGSGELQNIKYVYVEQTDSSDTVCQFNMLACDQQGQLLLRFDGFSKRVLTAQTPAVAAQKSNPAPLFYTSHWCEQQPQPSDLSADAAVVLVNTEQALNQSLAQQYSVIPLETTNNREAIDYQTEFAALKSQQRTFGHIVMQSFALGEVDLAQLLCLIQGLLGAKIRHSVKILYLAQANSAADWPLIAAVAGLARTLKFENAKVHLEVLGVEGDIAHYLPQLNAEIGAKPAPLHEVNYRAGQRLVRKMQPASVPELSKQLSHNLPYKQGGCYVLVGGAGGLGRLFSLYLAQNCQAKLMLLGRREQDQQIQSLLDEIAALGSHAKYYSVDVCDAEKLDVVLQHIRQQGPINGVIHAGGLIADSFILKTSAAALQQIVAPKIQGTLNLDALTAQDPLDFFVLFSSVAALMPNQGQCCYAAANSFMDSHAKYRANLVAQQQRSGLSLAINWPLWANGGMGVSEQDELHLKQEFGMKPLPTSQGIDIFNQLLAAAGNETFSHMLCLAGGLSDTVEKINRHFNIEQRQLSDPLLSQLLLNALKIRVAQITQMPLNSLSADARFTLWDIDSLGYVQLAKGLNQYFGIDVKPTLFFNCTNLAEVSQYLLGKHRASINGVYGKLDALAERYHSSALLDVEKSTAQSGLYLRQYNNREFYMVDHVVQGKYNVPGACYIEMARQAGALDQPERIVTGLTNNFWAKQLSSDGASFNAYIQLKTPANSNTSSRDYEIYSLPEQGEKMVHATGSIEYANALTTSRLAKLDLAAISQRCPVSWTPEQVYQQIHAEGLHVGETFMPMQSLVMNEYEALAQLTLPDSVLDTLDDYLLHPTMLTGVFQTALINNRTLGPSSKGIDSKRFIPVAIGNIQFYGCIGQTCYVHSQLIQTGRNNPDLKKFNLSICDKAGVVLASLSEFVIKSHQGTASVSQTVQPKAVATAQLAGASQDLDQKLHLQLHQHLKVMIAPVVGVSPDEIDSDDAFEVYGINSLMIVDLNKVVEDTFGGGHSKTLFFENKSIAELADYFLEEHHDTVLALFPQQAQQNKPEHKPAVAAAQIPSPLNQISQPAAKAAAKPTIKSTINPAAQEIAIIGVAGRYPKADNIEALWQNLKQGLDCVEAMPSQRLGYLAFYDNQDTTTTNALAGKRGGFIDDVDKFDPLFFNISPREAQRMDPQERLLLQTAWETIENAGYSRQSLKRSLLGNSAQQRAEKPNSKPVKVGVFIGALWQPYTALGVEASQNGQAIGPSGLLYNTANRISYFFNFSGPSMAVDTACSGSLTALHLACHSLQRGECLAALAGGVNLSLDSSKYLFLGQNEFLSSEGKCRAFGADGDGYVPGEGVGMVLLKPLDSAIEARDHIYGVIKATAINHGGKTNGYTVPNPNAQAEVISEVLQQSGIDPRTIGYVEAHGTGTALGDPIEIAGLSKAFAAFTSDTPDQTPDHTPAKQFCAIGSIKSNIGHLEANAGMAGLTKILLQLKYRQLVPSIHSQALNPNIDFAKTPFTVQRECVPWHSETPRRSALSSFGAGGANAHVLVEEYVPIQDPVPAVEEISSGPWISGPWRSGPWIVLLSAKTAPQLTIMAENLQRQLQSETITNPAAYLTSLAYTLQVGREAMPQRMACVVEDLAQLNLQLLAVINDNVANTDSVYTSETVTDELKALSKDQEFQTRFKQTLSNAFKHWQQKGKLQQLAEVYVAGVDIDWQQCYPGVQPQKLALPSYPFLRQSCWLPDERLPEQAKDANQSTLHFFTPQWQTLAIGESRGAAIDDESLVFISTLHQADIVQRLKARYPLAKVVNITKPLSFDRDFSLLVYRQLFSTLQALLKAKPANSQTLVVLSYQQQNPFYQGLSGLLKTLLQEKQILRAKQLLLPEPVLSEAAANERLIYQLEAELSDWPEPFCQINYCTADGRRQVKSYQEVALQAPQTQSFNTVFSTVFNTVFNDKGVYWITGGMGAIGQHLVAHIAQVAPQAQVIVSGRSDASHESPNHQTISAQLQDWQAQGFKVRYLQGDISEYAETESLLNTILQDHQHLSGIIHVAGSIKDSLFINKQPEQLEAVLAAKICGGIYLDQLTCDLPLSFFICFSSVAGVFGNVGQSDYALANGFLDAFVDHREKLRAQGKRSGKSLAINWPLWAEGGMTVTPATLAHFKQQWGTDPLPTDLALSCLSQSLTADYSQIMPLYGQEQQIKNHLFGQKTAAQKVANPVPAKPSRTVPQIKGVRPHLFKGVRAVIAELLLLDEAVLDDQQDITSYGFDSVSLSALAQQISQQFDVTVTSGLFYEHDTIEKIVEYITSSDNALATLEARPVASCWQPPLLPQKQVPQKLSPQIQSPQKQAAPANTAQIPIAIIGLDGRFPGADSIEQFWQQLVNKQVNVGDLSQDSFRFKDPSFSAFKDYKSGLLQGIDQFDASFFAIDETEARLMDPQQRLLLQSVWSVVEDAGYQMAQLSQRSTGLFIGVGSYDYMQLMCAEDHSVDTDTQVGVSPSMLANRISYLLDLKGPSEICDTACSSSIVAVHRAMRSLHEGECEMALVGGVNLLLSLRGYRGLKDLGFLTTSDNTFSFDARADGYVRGEGVGSILLKPLASAEQDRDNIYAVLKGSAVHHGGKATLSLLSPNKKGQIQAMVQAYQRAEVDPASVQYIEAHGTGTLLGDAAEISALKQAFREMQHEHNPNDASVNDRCGIGSIKPNIGHLEAASGIASLIKLTLALHKKQIPALAGFESLNPGLSLDNSPFYIVQESQPWDLPQASTATPVRRASLNSYGFGGVNAHLVLEEHQSMDREYPEAAEVITLSANDANGLANKAQALRYSLEANQASLKEISYTLSAGRQAMGVRLAIVVSTVDELIKALANYKADPACFYHELTAQKQVDDIPEQAENQQDAARQLAQRWVTGSPVDWDGWFSGHQPYRINLPTHPFQGKSYWYNQ